MKDNKINYFSRITKALLIILPLLLLFALLQTTVTVNAYEYASGTFGDDLTWVLDSDGTLTISGEGEMYFGDPEIPEILLEAPWAGYSIISVIIEPGILNIADDAFSYCYELTDISIPDSVTDIGYNAFEGCTGLAGITLPDSLISIGSSAFYGCTGLTSITIPDGVISIDDYAFYRCTGLTSVTISGSVTSIGLRVFYECNHLEMLSVDPENAVYDSRENCNAIIETDTNTLLVGCANTRIPDTVIHIDAGAFAYCTGLTSITIPDSVISIGNWAFEECTELTSIIISSSVTSIGDNVFSGCRSLSSLSVDPENPVYDSRDNCNALIETATNTLEIGCNNTTIPYSVTSIGFHAFYGCTGLTEIIIPESVTSIGSYAFSRCSGLTSITIPENVTSIESGLFYGCTGLTDITIPNGVTSIGERAFSWCTSLTSITIPDSVITIDPYAFSCSTGLADIIIPDSITMIAEGAFEGCTGLTSIYIPDGVISIGAFAFFNCTGLTNIIIPASVENIESMAFAGCSSLMDVFYDGTEEEWNRLSKDAGFGTIRLFSAEDYQEELTTEIITKDVPGGIAVTIMSSRGAIFYTLDGTHPGTGSIPYEGTFLLDEAGDYFINAITIDTTAGTYGDENLEFISLEKSGLPEIQEENGWIHITPEENVYYNLDLTEEPSAASSKYEGPILLSRTTVIRVKVIEDGKASGDTVSYYFSIKDNSIRYPDDSYQFGNRASSFGYPTLGYKINERVYTDIFGVAAGQFLYEIYGGTNWAGSCYGMSATALMFSRGILNLGDYGDTAQSVYDLMAPASRWNILTQLIERYQVAQFLPEMVMERNDVTSGGTMVISGLSQGEEAEKLLSAIQSFLSGGDPVILVLWRNDLEGSHAVVPYRLENGKIYIYDCNNPGGENIITYQRNNNGTYSFNYGQYSYAISINTLTTLLQKLEGLQTGQVSLTADGKELMLASLNTGNFQVMDPYGNAVTEYTVCRTTEDMLGAKTVLYLERGDYTIINTDMSASPLQISVSTEEEYYTVTVDDPQALIGIGTEYGHLYITVNAGNAAQIHVHTLNTSGRENDIEIIADYAKIYACTEMAVLVETTASVMTANGETRNLTENQDVLGMYYGSAAQRYIETARPGYDGITGCRLSTEITELPGTAFSLGVQVSGAEDAVIYVAIYDTNGRMLEIRSRQTEAGKTRYPFTISGQASKVQVFLVDQETGEPLTERLILE